MENMWVAAGTGFPQRGSRPASLAVADEEVANRVLAPVESENTSLKYEDALRCLQQALLNFPRMTFS
jgi:hypothetical protein